MNLKFITQTKLKTLRFNINWRFTLKRHPGNYVLGGVTLIKTCQWFKLLYSSIQTFDISDWLSKVTR